MPAFNPHVLWILAVVVGGILLLGGVTSVFNMLGRGWRALAREFPDDAPPEADAQRERSFIYVLAPGDDPAINRRGCLHFFMPWRWQHDIPVRIESGVEALRLTTDGGKLGVRGSVRIPWHEMELVSVGPMGMAYTFGKATYGEVATIRAGSCLLVVPGKQFAHEIAMLRRVGSGPEGQMAEGQMWREGRGEDGGV